MAQSKIVSATEVKNNFGNLVRQVRNNTYPEILVENRGKPIVAIVRVEDLTSLKELKEQQRRQKALEELREIRAEVQARIKGKLSSSEAQALANRASKEIITDLAKKGKVKFERDIT